MVLGNMRNLANLCMVAWTRFAAGTTSWQPWQRNVLTVASQIRMDSIRALLVREGAYEVDENDPLAPLPQDCLYGWREELMDWMDHLMMKHAFNVVTVETALSIIDRFLLTKPGCKYGTNKKAYILAFTTSLALATKLTETDKYLPLSHIASTMKLDVQVVERMEMCILKAVAWKVHPPTIIAFAFEYIDSLKTFDPENLKTEVSDYVAQCYRETRFRGEKRSVVALACVKVAVENSNLPIDILDHLKEIFK